MNLKNVFRRISMLILFVSALYTTVTVITNITFADLEMWREKSYQTPLDKLNISIEDKWIDLKEGIVKNKSFNDQKASSIVNQVVSEKGINLDEYPSATVIATGYTAGIESTGKTPDHPGYGITYSGVEVKRDVYSTIAADLDVYPLGTILYIPDYGYGIVADIGSAIKGNKIDLYYQTVEDVYAEWGKQEVEVYIIELGNGELTEEDIAKLNNTEAIKVGTD